MTITKDHKELMTEIGVERDHFQHICEAIDIILPTIHLPERSKRILEGVLKGGKTFAVLGKEYDITRERVRQIFYKSLYIAKGKLIDMATSQARVVELNDRVKQLTLQKSFIKQYVMKVFDNSENANKTNDDILYKPIEQLNCSIRLKNCLKSAEINSLREVLDLSVNELLRYRNFGKKSLNELKDILANLGIKWGRK